MEYDARTVAASDGQGADRAHEGPAVEVEGVCDRFPEFEASYGGTRQQGFLVPVEDQVVGGEFVGKDLVGVDGVEEPHLSEPHAGWLPVESEKAETQAVFE